MPEADGASASSMCVSSADTVYVLHCFQEKTRETAEVESDLAEKRFRELTKESSQ